MAKMHQIQFRRWGSSQLSPNPLAGFKGPTSKGEKGKRREGKEEERTEGEGKRTPLSKCLRTGLTALCHKRDREYGRLKMRQEHLN